ncbi:MAG: glutamine-hydrolyzing GMP synthase [Tissierellia bacterium]|nr:glutamine-hydrolyzing GMP synthase [Tissierellia bacterium]
MENVSTFINDSIEEIKATVGDKKAILALSGGVDSSVCAVLVHRAIKDNLTCIFVDHGFLRKGEREEVVKLFQGEYHMNLIVVDAEARFMDKVKGVDDPEKKRKIIGEEFIRVFEEEKRKLTDAEFLVQGTIYPDIAESINADGEVAVKSHHNVGGLPEDVDFELVEPLKTLYKDEVRAVGRELGMPSEMVDRQPFPGPGLAVRVLGELTKEKLDILRDADYIFRDEIKKAGMQNDIWQYFAVLPGIKAVGIKNGKRSYNHTIILRAVNTTDAVVANWVHIPFEVLEKISERITSEVDEVVRVAYDITSKPPGTIEWE